MNAQRQVVLEEVMLDDIQGAMAMQGLLRGYHDRKALREANAQMERIQLIFDTIDLNHNRKIEISEIEAEIHADFPNLHLKKVATVDELLKYGTDTPDILLFSEFLMMCMDLQDIQLNGKSMAMLSDAAERTLFDQKKKSTSARTIQASIRMKAAKTTHKQTVASISVQGLLRGALSRRRVESEKGKHTAVVRASVKALADRRVLHRELTMRHDESMPPSCHRHRNRDCNHNRNRNCDRQGNHSHENLDSNHTHN